MLEFEENQKHNRASLVGQQQRRRLQCRRWQEIWVQSLGQEDALEESMTTHSSIAGKILWTEELGGLQSMGSHTVRVHMHKQQQRKGDD